MMNFKMFFRTGVSSIAVAGCVALGATVMVDTYAASKTNFNKQQCKVENGNVRALAIPGTGSVSCVCPSASAAAILDEKQRPAGAASIEDCYIQTPQQITNFNLPTVTTNPPVDNNPPVAQEGNPGNDPSGPSNVHEHVGMAGEDPSGKTGDFSGGQLGSGNTGDRGNSQ
jgi:hypothetical protein